MSWTEAVGLLGALGLGALGAAIVQGFTGARAAGAQRLHETTLREQDRQHELRMGQLADARSVRDRRSQRLHDNLASMVEMALRLGERTNRLRLWPDQFDKPDPWLDAAVDKIFDLRALIVLDAETEPLMRAVDDASLAYRQFLLAIEARKDMV